MGNALTQRRTPAELAASGQTIEIADKISGFERLAGIVEADLAALDEGQAPPDWREAQVTGRMTFAFADDGGRLPLLRGRASTTVYAVCQRCIRPMKLTLDVPLEYLLADGQLEGFEVWELDGPTLRPVDLVDEALVMAIPLSVVHVDRDDCRHMTTEAGEAEDRTRPFAALRAQMEKTD